MGSLRSVFVFVKSNQGGVKFYGGRRLAGCFDVGYGRLICRPPPLKAAVHPWEDRHEPFLLCDGVERAVKSLMRVVQRANPSALKR